MPVEERVLEQQFGRVAHQPARVGAGSRKRLLRPKRPPQIRRRFVGRDSSVGQLRQPIGNLVDEAMPDLPELSGRHFQRRPPLSERFELRRKIHRSPRTSLIFCGGESHRPPS